MTREQHYKEAEALLAEAQTIPFGHTHRTALVAEAQVHATLAAARLPIDVVMNAGPGR